MNYRSEIEANARAHQTLAFSEIRANYVSGIKKVLLQLSTGGGKTYIFSMLLDAARRNGTRSLMVVKGRALVDQASERLASHNIDHSVFMAGDRRYDPSKLIQVCSVDTCRARHTYPEADFVVIDEAHLAVSDSFQCFLSHYPNAHWLPVTATPWTKCGMASLAQSVVYPISFSGLLEAGHLVPPKVFAPSIFDASKITVAAGEYVESELVDAFDKQNIYGDVLGSYRKHCSDGFTWVFAINVVHANKVKEFFADNGINGVVITGKTPLQERKHLIDTERLVISIGTLTAGVDLPKLNNIIMLRPTMSKILYTQMLGRGTRPYDGKDHFKVFDHSGNYERFGDIRDEQKHDLKPIEKKKNGQIKGEAPVKVCGNCKAVVPAGVHFCPECEHKFQVKSFDVKDGGHEMVELRSDLRSRMEFRAEHHLKKVWSLGHKKHRIWYLLIEDFGEAVVRSNNDIANKYINRHDTWSLNPSKAPGPFGYKKYYVY